ncbi:MAG TPA: amidase, partial [Anaerolineales bacterium]
MDTASLTLTQARQLISNGELTPDSLLSACLDQIHRLDPEINAFITVIASGASSGTIAKHIERSEDEQSHHSVEPPLSSLPLAVKDLYDTARIRTTAGTRFFADRIPDRDAAAVEKLKTAGALILGKTNTHEIALGVTNINAFTGNCLNPWDTKRITGGSSGGSAAAVATGMVLAALGTDTGGSIRIPASLCGVVGLKPTYGRVSLRGIVPLSWNLDHAGPLAKSACDAALLLQVLAGYDPEDPASVDAPVDDYLAHIDDGVAGWRIALATGEYIEDSDAEVLSAVHAAADVFHSLGAQVDEVEIPWLREAALANSVMTQADGAAFHRERLREHPDRFGADVRARLETGAAFTSTEYSLARRTQSECRRKAEIFFQEHDVLILPSTPIPAPLIEGTDAIEQARRLTRFTAPFNLTGLPAISLPCGLSSEGLPLGLQIVGAPWRESRVLRAGHAYEQRRGEFFWQEAPPRTAM